MAWRGDVVQQREVARAGLLLAQEARVFQGDGGLVGEHAQDFEVALVEHLFLPALHGHDADDAVVRR